MDETERLENILKEREIAEQRAVSEVLSAEKVLATRQSEIAELKSQIDEIEKKEKDYRSTKVKNAVSRANAVEMNASIAYAESLRRQMIELQRVVDERSLDVTSAEKYLEGARNDLETVREEKKKVASLLANRRDGS